MDIGNLSEFTKQASALVKTAISKKFLGKMVKDKNVILGSADDIGRAVFKQGPIRFVRKAANKAGGKSAVRDIYKGLGRRFGISGSKIRDVRKGLGARVAGTISGTGKKNVTVINKNIVKHKRSGDAKIGLRETYFHEQFHRKVPIIGQSEIAAHAYGAFKGRKRSALAGVGHLARTRPDRLLLESVPAVGVTALTGTSMSSGKNKNA